MEATFSLLHLALFFLPLSPQTDDTIEHLSWIYPVDCEKKRCKRERSREEKQCLRCRVHNGEGERKKVHTYTQNTADIRHITARERVKASEEDCFDTSSIKVTLVSIWERIKLTNSNSQHAEEERCFAFHRQWQGRIQVKCSRTLKTRGWGVTSLADPHGN